MWSVYNVCSATLIPGIFLSVVVVLIASSLIKNFDPKISYAIIRWILIIFPAIYLIMLLREIIIYWYSGVAYENYTFLSRATGPYWWAYWAMLIGGLLPMFLLIKKLGRNPWFIFLAALSINSGAIFELILINFRHFDFFLPALLAFRNGIIVGLVVTLIGYFLQQRKQNKES